MNFNEEKLRNGKDLGKILRQNLNRGVDFQEIFDIIGAEEALTAGRNR